MSKSWKFILGGGMVNVLFNVRRRQTSLGSVPWSLADRWLSASSDRALFKVGWDAGARLPNPIVEFRTFCSEKLNFFKQHLIYSHFVNVLRVSRNCKPSQRLFKQERGHYFGLKQPCYVGRAYIYWEFIGSFIHSFIPGSSSIPSNR